MNGGTTYSRSFSFMCVIVAIFIPFAPNDSVDSGEPSVEFSNSVTDLVSAVEHAIGSGWQHDHGRRSRRRARAYPNRAVESVVSGSIIHRSIPDDQHGLPWAALLL